MKKEGERARACARCAAHNAPCVAAATAAAANGSAISAANMTANTAQLLIHRLMAALVGPISRASSVCVVLCCVLETVSFFLATTPCGPSSRSSACYGL